MSVERSRGTRDSGKQLMLYRMLHLATLLISVDAKARVVPAGFSFGVPASCTGASRTAETTRIPVNPEV